MTTHIQTNGRKRVLHVLAGPLGRGGIEVWLSQVTPHLIGYGYQVDFLVYTSGVDPLREPLTALGCQVHLVPLQRTPWGMMRFIGDFRKVLKEGKYDIVHCHGGLLTGAFARFAASQGVPVRIAHSHGSAENKETARRITCFGRFLLRRWLRSFATDQMACSQEAGEYLFGNHWRNDSKAAVLHCGIDVTPFCSVPTGVSSCRHWGLDDREDPG